MKVLLHVDVAKLGHFGDVVDVTDGYARNYLLPQQLAVVPTESNIKAVEEDRARKAEDRKLARDSLVKLAEKVNGAEVTISAKANEQGHLYGSVGPEDVAKALQEERFEVQLRHVVMNEHFTMLGPYSVKLRFTDDLEAEVKVWVVRPEGQVSESEPEQSQQHDE